MTTPECPEPNSASALSDAFDQVMAYHQRTKHQFEAYAKGPGNLDWDNQPNPFRQYEGASSIRLPLTADDIQVPFAELSQPNGQAPLPRNLRSIAALLETSLALSAWKQYGDARWSLRCNPSSGNLHPTEAYIVAVGIEGLQDGIYHYRVDQHSLELRCEFTQQTALKGLFIGLTSIHWREAWKYGERAFRYCQLDIGHILAGLNYSSRLLGWRCALDAQLTDSQLGFLLGVDRTDDFIGAEQEVPEILINLVAREGNTNRIGASEIVALAQTGIWLGKANILDKRHFYHWPIIEKIAAACRKPNWQLPAITFADLPDPIPSQCTEPASKLMRRRRSAQAFDGSTTMELADFFRLLDQLIPRQNTPPWQIFSGSPRLHLVFFIHRVKDLTPGLYVLARSMAGLHLLKNQFKTEFLWQSVPGAPTHFNFYHLVSANAKNAASRLSCHQAIAGDSAFSLAMLAEFATPLKQTPWLYSQLYWEAGLIGQILYLEAEACGLRGTGIGCFFDDGVHSLLGIKDFELQSLYHFTVGGAITDNRIISLPPYSHISQ